MNPHVQPGKGFYRKPGPRLDEQLDKRCSWRRCAGDQREGVFREVFEYVRDHPGCDRLQIGRALHIRFDHLAGFLNQLVFNPRGEFRVFRVPGGPLHRYGYVYYTRAGARPGDGDGDDWTPNSAPLQAPRTGRRSRGRV